MSYPITDSNWTILCDGKLTFFGVMHKQFDLMAEKYHWNPTTRETYAQECERYIFPLMNDRPLESYTADELEQIFVTICCNGKINAQSTRKHYRQMIERVVEIAVQEEGMKNSLWGVRFSGATTRKRVEEQERRTLPKSMTPLQQCALGESIYALAEKHGDMLGSMFSYESGLRMKESAGGSVGDFHEPQLDQDFSSIAVHSVTIGQGHERHDKPKTKNGYRIATLGPRATKIVRQKIAEIRRQIDTGEIRLDPYSNVSVIDAIPLAGSRKDPLVPCSSVQLSNAYRIALRDAGYGEDDYLAAQSITQSPEFLEAERRATPTELGFAPEKDPTAYASRRQYCTDAHIVGATPEERQYGMGHRIENTAVDRRDFRNPDKFTAFAEKMNKRPSVNPAVLLPKETAMEGSCYQNPDFYSETVRLPVKKGKYIIRITSHEPLTPATAALTYPERIEVSNRCYQQKSTAAQRREVNVLNDYYDTFRKAYAILEQRKAAREEDKEQSSETG